MSVCFFGSRLAYSCIQLIILIWFMSCWRIKYDDDDDDDDVFGMVEAMHNLPQKSHVTITTSLLWLICHHVDRIDVASVLFFSRPRSEGWPHHGRAFSIYLCPLSF